MYQRQPYILGQPSIIWRYCPVSWPRHPEADPLHNPADHSLPFHCILLFIAWYVAGSLDFVTAACHKSFHPQANVSVCASHNYLLQMSKAFIKTDMAATSYTSPGTLLVLWISSFSCFPSSKPMFPRSYNQAGLIRSRASPARKWQLAVTSDPSPLLPCCFKCRHCR